MASKALKDEASHITSPRTLRGKTVSSRLALTCGQDPVQAKLDRAERNGSPDIDNSGRGALRVRNVAFEINDVYCEGAEKKEQERLENGGLTNAEFQRFIFAANESIYHPSYQPPSNPVSIALTIPAAYVAAETVIATNGKSYVAMRSQDSGQILSYVSDTACLNPNTVVLNTTPKSALETLSLVTNPSKPPSLTKPDYSQFFEKAATESPAQDSAPKVESVVFKKPKQPTTPWDITPKSSFILLDPKLELNS